MAGQGTEVQGARVGGYGWGRSVVRDLVKWIMRCTVKVQGS